MPNNDNKEPRQLPIFALASHPERQPAIPGQAGKTARNTAFSDIDLNRWKDYDEVLTGSLWILGERDRSGPHRGDYWGNFVPQIPRQVLLRFTKAGEIVVDLFSGMGTTLIECRRMGRHGIGVELNPEVAEASRERIAKAGNEHQVISEVIIGDSSSIETINMVRQRLLALGQTQVHCAILHPPYHNIIAFSDDRRDLSGCASLDEFLGRFSIVVAHGVELLAPGRFLALVIGDIYANSEWIPLGFECMQVCRQAGLRLKAINVKEMRGNERGKGVNENLWKYRALVAGTYLFKHEYVMIFQKDSARKGSLVEKKRSSAERPTLS
jgi:hypothetical protein